MRTAIHLVGGQALPVYMGMLYAKTKEHILIATEGTNAVAQRIKNVAAKRGLFSRIEKTLPYDIENIAMRINQTLPHGEGFKLNLTGGTKPMFAGAFSTGIKQGGEPFYVESTTRQVIKLIPPFATESYNVPLTIEEFLELSGYRILNPGRWADDAGREKRRRWTVIMNKNSKIVSNLYKPQNMRMLAKSGQQQRPCLFKSGKITVELDQRMHGSIQIEDQRYEANNWPGVASYALGGWFEEYCYQLLEALIQQGVVTDMRIGMEVDYIGSNERKPIQELDVVLTDGYTLTIVECKAGGVRQEQIQKLENLANSIGGTYGRGILASNFPLYGRLPERVRNSKSVSAWYGWGLTQKNAGKAFVQPAGSILTADGSRAKKKKGDHRKRRTRKSKDEYC